MSITVAGGSPAVRTAPGVLHSRDILCFSHDWSGDPLSKTHLMRLLARDNRILWVNSIGYRKPTASRRDLARALQKVCRAMQPVYEAEPNIFILNPLAVPSHGSRLIWALNRRFLQWQVKRAMRQLGFRDVINWVFNPAAAVIARSFNEDLLIYHCVDEYTAFSGVPAKGIAELERKLLLSADLVIVSAHRLLQSKGQLNQHTVLVRHGVDFSHFARSLDPRLPVPDELARLPRPVLGFFGLIADWVDTELLAQVAKHFSGGSLVLIGKASVDLSDLRRLPNVHILGQKPYGDLPAYCKGFDVALMPFRVNDLTLSANPLKVREYLAAGLPVVSTAIPEVEVLGQCRIGRDPLGFIREIEAALADPGPARARSSAIRSESWEARLAEIESHLSRALGMNHNL